MPMLAVNDDAVLVGRVREDGSQENGLDLFVVADNLRRGAAGNAVRIAEAWVRAPVLKGPRRPVRRGRCQNGSRSRMPVPRLPKSPRPVRSRGLPESQRELARVAPALQNRLPCSAEPRSSCCLLPGIALAQTTAAER